MLQRVLKAVNRATRIMNELHEMQVVGDESMPELEHDPVDTPAGNSMYFVNSNNGKNHIVGT